MAEHVFSGHLLEKVLHSRKVLDPHLPEKLVNRGALLVGADRCSTADASRRETKALGNLKGT